MALGNKELRVVVIKATLTASHHRGGHGVVWCRVTGSNHRCGALDLIQTRLSTDFDIQASRMHVTRREKMHRKRTIRVAK